MRTFSVLMSVYAKDNAEWLDQALNSALVNQSILPSEIIVVEDGLLTPELYSVIEKYKSIFDNFISVKIQQNGGLGNALKIGLNSCSYDIIARMDSDDIAMNNRFEKQLDILKANSQIDVVGAWIDEFQITIDNVVSIRKLPEYHKDIICFAHKRNPINHPVVMFRKSAVEKVGGYQNCPLFEDYFLWIRMLMSGSKFYNIQESLLYFRFSNQMVKRRGGIKYALDEFKFQYWMFKVGFNNFAVFAFNSIVRFLSRIIPNKIRKCLYKYVLRKH